MLCVGVAEVKAFNNEYSCTAESLTNVGFNPNSNIVETEAGKATQSNIVRLSGVLTRNVSVSGNAGSSQLGKVNETNNVIWFLEIAPAGTIMWTLFEEDNRWPALYKARPVTLISTKSYDFGGAVSFTTFYTCK